MIRRTPQPYHRKGKEPHSVSNFDVIENRDRVCDDGIRSRPAADRVRPGNADPLQERLYTYTIRVCTAMTSRLIIMILMEYAGSYEKLLFGTRV